MKKILFLTVFSLAAFAASARDIQAVFSYSTFYSPQKGPYVETYVTILGQSVRFTKNAGGKYQAAAEITLIFSKEDSIRYADKFILKSPELTDTLQPVNFTDQQRISLPNGEYMLELKLSDKHSSGPLFTHKEKITLSYPSSLITFSDIQPVESYRKSETPGILTKSGYDLVPYTVVKGKFFYPEKETSLTFYAELYNTPAVLGDEPFLLNYYIQTHPGKIMVEKLRKFSRQTPQPVSVLFTELPLHELPTGEYKLVVEARNRNNELLAFKEMLFLRESDGMAGNAPVDYHSVDIAGTFSQAYTNRDTLAEYIRSLRPISTSYEMTFADNQLKIADIRLMQQFFFSFWSKRNPENPEAEWLRYHTEVKKVNAAYGSRIRKGYDTDRGRIYLKYGPPNSITESPREPSAYPYEIWHYQQMGNQFNRKFVFYNPDLVTNDYVLLHSDVPGEVNDPAWETRIHSRNNMRQSIDDDQTPGHFGGRSSDYFKNPR